LSTVNTNAFPVLFIFYYIILSKTQQAEKQARKCQVNAVKRTHKPDAPPLRGRAKPGIAGNHADVRAALTTAPTELVTPKKYSAAVFSEIERAARRLKKRFTARPCFYLKSQ
jgi:hypothetical protein